jgi:hypothetical protein
VADLGHDGGLDMITFWVDNPQRENYGYLRFNTLPDPVRVPGWWGHSTQGAGMALADLNGNGRPEVILAHVDNPTGENFGYVRIGWEVGDPPPPPPGVVIGDATAAEGDTGTTTMEFTVRLLQPSRQPVSVAFATGDGEALAGPDYRSTGGIVTFAPGEVSKTVVVLVNGDTASEPDERFFVRLSAPVNATIVGGRATGTIWNDDLPPPQVSIDSVTQAEGHLGPTAFTFTVTLSHASTQSVTVFFRTADGTATWPADYFATSGIVTFLPGETTRAITIEVVGDRVGEDDETFHVELYNPVNAELAEGGAVGVGTIVNDDLFISVP